MEKALIHAELPECIHVETTEVRKHNVLAKDIYLRER